MLVIAASGRILAQAARQAGKPPRVIDRFGDRDTRAAARDLRVAAGRDGRFHGPSLLEVADRLSPPGRGEALVWGGGLEGEPDVLAQLAENRELLGNGPEAVRKATDPAAWAVLLEGLGLPFPEIRLSPPADTGPWLRKEAGGSGGGHVRPAEEAAAGPGSYFQRRAPGRPHSVLFAADGQRARVLGITEQWTVRDQTGGPGDFRYAGALAHAPLPEPLVGELTAAVEALTAAWGLRGLNGVDFLVDGPRFRMLELNPRPVATLELYREQLAPAPFLLHLSGSRGSLPRLRRLPPRLHRGHAVVYAEVPVRIRRGLLARPWCGDLPPVGTVVPAGAPVFTVHAAHARREEARCLLERRYRWAQRRLRAAPLAETSHSA